MKLSFVNFNPLYYIGKKDSTLRQLSYALAKNRGRYLPRVAFESIVNDYKSLGATRIDFIFQQQLPSRRPQGGTAYDQLREFIWGTKANKQKKAKKKSVDWVKNQLDRNID